MGGAAGRWSVLIIVVCWGQFSASKTARHLCPKPAVPEDAILVTLRSDVNLTCAGCEGRASWSRRSPHGTSRSFAESDHLVLRAVMYEDEDNYTCYKDGAPVCSVELVVRDERQDDTILSCYHRHPTHNITCEWTPTGQLHPSSTITLIKAIFPLPPVFSSCTYNGPGETFFCPSLYAEGDSTKQVFSVCVSGRTDSQLTAKLEAYPRDLLHIGPPLDVSVTPVVGHPRRLWVTWRRPLFWESGFYGLRYQVLYGVENSPHRSNGTTSQAAFVIHDAVMGRKHSVRVRAIEEYNENWGSWSEQAVAVPWSAGLTTMVSERSGGEGKGPQEYDPPTSQEEQDPEDENELPDVEVPLLTPRLAWIAPCVALSLVVFFFLGLWIRYQEIKIVKLQWGFLRSLFHPSSKVNVAQPPESESRLMSPPSSMAVTIPPPLIGE